MNNIWLSLEILPYCTLVCTKTFSDEKSRPNRLNPHSILVSHSLNRLGVFLLHLGLAISWSRHINIISTNISSAIAAVKRVRPFINTNSAAARDFSYSIRNSENILQIRKPRNNYPKLSFSYSGTVFLE